MEMANFVNGDLFDIFWNLSPQNKTRDVT